MSKKPRTHPKIHPLVGFLSDKTWQGSYEHAKCLGELNISRKRIPTKTTGVAVDHWCGFQSVCLIELQLFEDQQFPR